GVARRRPGTASRPRLPRRGKRGSGGIAARPHDRALAGAMSSAPVSSRLVAAAAALAFYGSLVVWLTWPLAAHMSTHFPATHAAARFDLLHIAWVLAHESRALVSDPAQFTEGNIFHPTRHVLFYSQASLGALPFYAPVFWSTGNPALALNFTFLTCIALT